MSTRRSLCSTVQENFSIDSVVSFLDCIPFSPPFLLFIPLLVQWYHIVNYGTYLAPPDPTSVCAWWALLSDDKVRAQYRIPLCMMTFIAVKTVHRALLRITYNNGVSTDSISMGMGIENAHQVLITVLSRRPTEMGQRGLRSDRRFQWHWQGDCAPFD